MALLFGRKGNRKSGVAPVTDSVVYPSTVETA